MGPATHSRMSERKQCTAEYMQRRCSLEEGHDGRHLSRDDYGSVEWGEQPERVREWEWVYGLGMRLVWKDIPR